MEQIQIIDSKNHVGETVTIGAWVANKRSSGKIAFLQLRDGTAFFQGVVVKSEVPEEVFQTAKNLQQETSVLVTGEIREDSRYKCGSGKREPRLSDHTKRTRNRLLDGSSSFMATFFKTTCDYADQK